MEQGNELVQKAASGDADAFRLLCERHGVSIGNSVAQRIPEKYRGYVTALDVLQDAYLRAWISLHTLKNRSEPAFVDWLRQAALNVLSDLLRAQNRQKRGGGITHQEIKPSQLARHFLHAVSSTASQHARAKEARTLIARALRALSRDYRFVIIYCWLKERPLDWVASKLNRSPEAVAVLRRRAQSALGTQLANHFSTSAP